MERKRNLGCEGDEEDYVTVFSNEEDSEGEGYIVEGEGDMLPNEILEDLDGYLDDINDRLMISRMVNDSVTKGVVNAIEQEAAEVIFFKDLEIEQLRKSVVLNSGSDNEVGDRVGNGKELDIVSLGGIRGYDNVRESVDRLRVVASEQCARIKEGLDAVRGCNSMKRTGSGEMVGLGGILPEKASENWGVVYELLNCLQNTVNVMCTQVSDDLHMSRVSLGEWQQQKEIEGDIETKVIQCFSEEKRGSQNANMSFDNQNVKWQEKLDELSELHNELASLLKSLNNSETGHLFSSGSFDLDGSHSKFHGNHVMPPTSIWNRNEKKEDSKLTEKEAFDATQLKHLNREELVSYFNLAIRKMRRDHESTVATMTDDYYSLKREYLNVKKRTPSLQHLKDNNEVDMMRKKIPDVIEKLDKMLSETAGFALLCNGESITKLKDKVDSLVSENCQLNDLLKVQGKEISCLWTQISDAKEKILQHSLVEENMMKVIENLNATIEDERIEAAITETINKCFLGELVEQIRCDSEDSNMELQNVKEMYDIILREAISNEKCDFGDPYMELLITEDICGLVFREAVKDTQQIYSKLYSKYVLANEKSISHEKKALEKETRLWQIIEEKERLGKQVLELDSVLQEKEKIVDDLSATLANEREHFEHASKELSNLREETSRQQIEASECTKELESARVALSDGFEQIKRKKIENSKLNQILQNKIDELKQVDGQREALHALSEERYKQLELAEGKSEELEKQMKAVILDVQMFSNTLVDFEHRVEDGVKKNSLRLEALSSQIKWVIGKAKMLSRSVLVYKDQLEKRNEDIQRAEIEVDLLGDEVETLLGLLEKIYIGLDHYSPVLKHYPGIMETLQLVRRELNGCHSKSV